MLQWLPQWLPQWLQWLTQWLLQWPLQWLLQWGSWPRSAWFLQEHPFCVSHCCLKLLVFERKVLVVLLAEVDCFSFLFLSLSQALLKLKHLKLFPLNQGCCLLSQVRCFVPLFAKTT